MLMLMFNGRDAYVQCSVVGTDLRAAMADESVIVRCAS